MTGLKLARRTGRVWKLTTILRRTGVAVAARAGHHAGRQEAKTDANIISRDVHPRSVSARRLRRARTGPDRQRHRRHHPLREFQPVRGYGDGGRALWPLRQAREGHWRRSAIWRLLQLLVRDRPTAAFLKHV